MDDDDDDDDEGDIGIFFVGATLLPGSACVVFVTTAVRSFLGTNVGSFTMSGVEEVIISTLGCRLPALVVTKVVDVDEVTAAVVGVTDLEAICVAVVVVVVVDILVEHVVVSDPRLKTRV